MSENRLEITFCSPNNNFLAPFPIHILWQSICPGLEIVSPVREQILRMVNCVKEIFGFCELVCPSKFFAFYLEFLIQPFILNPDHHRFAGSLNHKQLRRLLTLITFISVLTQDSLVLSSFLRYLVWGFHLKNI